MYYTYLPMYDIIYQPTYQVLVRTDLEHTLDRQPTVDVALAAARRFIVGLSPSTSISQLDDADEKLLPINSSTQVTESDSDQPGTFRLKEVTLRDPYHDNNDTNESSL